jgi:hypothetical protein
VDTRDGAADEYAVADGGGGDELDGVERDEAGGEGCAGGVRGWQQRGSLAEGNLRGSLRHPCKHLPYRRASTHRTRTTVTHGAGAVRTSMAHDEQQASHLPAEGLTMVVGMVGQHELHGLVAAQRRAARVRRRRLGLALFDRPLLLLEGLAVEAHASALDGQSEREPLLNALRMQLGHTHLLSVRVDGDKDEESGRDLSA